MLTLRLVQVLVILQASWVITLPLDPTEEIFCENKNIIDCKPDYDVCGTDGIIYNSSCSFAKARCLNHALAVQSSLDKCRITSTLPTTVQTNPTTIQTTLAPTTTETTTPTTTVTPTPTTTVTTTPPLPTEDPSFCRAKSCSLLDKVFVCGTDGNFYLNRCYLRLARCKDPTIQFAHEGAC